MTGTGSGGNTLLRYVSFCCYLPLIELLLSRGAAADRRNGAGYRPIHAVLDHGHDGATDAARRMLGHGA